MKSLIALLMLTAAAQAQTLSGTYICMSETSAWTTMNGEDCTRRGGQLHPLYSSAMGGITTLSTNSGVSITNSVRRCDEGWTLVDSGSRPMCVRELREPK